jgi:hypothetical protein
MQKNNVKEIVGKLNIVCPEVQCICGSVSKSGEVVDSAFTQGSVRYMDQKLLRPYSKARQAATRLCRINGTRFLNGFAIPDENIQAVRAGLQAIYQELASERLNLEAKLPDHMREWALKHPEILPYQIKFPTARMIVESIGMMVSEFKINPSDLQSTGIKDGISHEISGLAARTLSEIAQDVRDSWSPEAQGATTRSRGVLERMKHKLDSLAFIDAELSEVAQMIGRTLSELPSTGPIRGNDFMVLSGIMNTLSDPANVVKTARIAAKDSPTSLWGAPALPLVEQPALPATGSPSQEDTKQTSQLVQDSINQALFTLGLQDELGTQDAVPVEDPLPVMPAAIVAPSTPVVSDSAWAW